MWVYAVGRDDLAPLEMPARFKHDIAYFMTPAGQGGTPMLAVGEFWVRSDEARRWLADGVMRLVSPLDSQNQAEVELSEEQERWLEWMVANDVQHVRLAS